MRKENKTVSVEALKPNPENERVITDEAVKAVAGSIKQFGQVKPIVANAQLVIIAGHTTLQALKSVGHTQADVLILHDITPEQEERLRIADNKSGELSQWDEAKLAKVLGGWEEEEALDFGFTKNDWDKLTKEAEETVKEAKAKEIESKAGEVVKLGPHTLNVGADCLDFVDTVKRSWKRYQSKLEKNEE